MAENREVVYSARKHRIREGPFLSRTRLLLPVASLLILSFSISLSAQTPLGTSVFVIPFDFKTCKDRAAQALGAEGFGGREELDNGWQAYKGATAASISCIHGSSGSVVSLVVSGNNQADVRLRLIDLIWNARTTPTTTTTTTATTPTTSTPTTPPTSTTTSTTPPRIPLTGTISPGIVVDKGRPVQWGIRADHFRDGMVQGGGDNQPKYRIGETVLVTCPGVPTFAGGGIWGTGIYTADSTICAVAVHAGLATVQQGGTFNLEFFSDAGTYTGTLQNGIQSSSYGSFPSGAIRLSPPPRITTYDIDRPRTPAPAQPAPLTGGRRIEYFVKGQDLRDGNVPNEGNQTRYRNGDRVLVNCPGYPSLPGGASFGSGPYTGDSTVCYAAMHSGLITLQQGGSFYVEFVPDAGTYVGSDRNGYRSQWWERPYPNGAFRVSR